MKEKHLILHHRADADGWFSGCLLALQLREQGYSTFLQGVDYKEPEPDLNSILSQGYTGVHLTDFTMSKEWMLRWSLEFPKSMWFDHHAGPIEEARPYSYHEAPGLRDVQFSATYLVAMHSPEIQQNQYWVRLIDVADLHKKEDLAVFEDAMNFGAYLSLSLGHAAEIFGLIKSLSNPNNASGWSRIIWSNPLADYIKTGEKIRRQQEESAKRVTHSWFFYDGQKFPAVNCYHNSLVYDDRFKDAAAIVMYRIEGGHVVLSLRSIREGFSVRRLAEMMGGGGHERAAGCKVSFEFFHTHLIENKTN